MRLLAAVCSKLQKTAAVFLQLAQSHTRHNTSTKPIGGTFLSEYSQNSGFAEQSTQALDDMINADLRDQDFINYLNLLPVDMNATSRILETELQAPGFHFSDREMEITSANLQRPTLDRAFDWFSWDDYYGTTSI